MASENDILSKAIDAVRQTPTPPGPPAQAIAATVDRLRAAPMPARDVVSQSHWTPLRWGRWAVAAGLLIACGYAFGVLSRSKAVDYDSLRAEVTAAVIEQVTPAIEDRLAEKLAEQSRLDIALVAERLREDLQDQSNQQLARFAVQTASASEASTTRLLDELAGYIHEVRLKDRQWLATAIEQLEQKHEDDRKELYSGLRQLAMYTGDGFRQTREDFVQLVSSITPETGGIRPVSPQD